MHEAPLTQKYISNQAALCWTTWTWAKASPLRETLNHVDFCWNYWILQSYGKRDHTFIFTLNIFFTFHSLHFWVDFFHRARNTLWDCFLHKGYINAHLCINIWCISDLCYLFNAWWQALWNKIQVLIQNQHLILPATHTHTKEQN